MTASTRKRDNERLARRLLEEVWSGGNTELVDELVNDGYVEHNPSNPTRQGRDELIAYVEEIRSGIPDFEKSVEDTVVADDKVVVRYVATGTHDGELNGIEPTGNRLSVDGIIIYRIEDGGIAEAWENSDTLGLLEQLGVG